MKSKLLPLLLPVFFFINGCKKETIINPVEVAKPAIGFVEQARTFLKANYTAGSLGDLSVDASILYKLDSGRYFIKVHFKSQGNKNFILLSADSIHGIKNGVLLHVDKTSNTLKGEKFTGTIITKELNGNIKEIKKIVDGFKVKNISNRTSSDVYRELPEVIVMVIEIAEVALAGEIGII